MRVASLLLCFAVVAHSAMAYEGDLMTIEGIEKALRQMKEMEELRNLSPRSGNSDEDLEALERFELSGMKEWLQMKAISLKDKAKATFLENGGAVLLEKGKALCDAFNVTVDSVSCENNLCKSCISVNSFPFSGQSACATFGVVDKFTIGCSVTMAGKEMFKKSLGLTSLTAACVPLPVPLGSICVQGVEYSKDQEKNEKRLCLVAALSRFSVGARMCATKGPTGLTPSVEKVKAEAIAEQDNFLFKYDGKTITSILSEYFGVSE